MARCNSNKWSTAWVDKSKPFLRVKLPMSEFPLHLSNRSGIFLGMMTFTLDTNCIIDIDLGRSSAKFIQEIVGAHRQNRTDAAFVAVSASERQLGDRYLDTYDEFLDRLRSLKLDDIPQIRGLMYYDISYWDQALWAGDDEVRERLIHDNLFPNIDFEFSDFAGAAGIANNGTLTRKAHKWRNAWCDRQMLWAHDFHSRDVFVTSDGNFRKLMGCEGFEDLQVCTPQEAVALIP